MRDHSKTVVPNLFGTRDQFRGRQFFHRWRAEGERWFRLQCQRWGAAEGALVACLLLTFCCTACFLTVHGPGVGDYCSRTSLFRTRPSQRQLEMCSGITLFLEHLLCVQSLIWLSPFKDSFLAKVIYPENGRLQLLPSLCWSDTHFVGCSAYGLSKVRQKLTLTVAY